MDILQELESTFIEEYESALFLIEKQKYKSATILLAKALFALLDYLIFIKYGKLPKNHSERFRILETREKEIYQLVDSVWGKYTDTYSKPSLEQSGNLFIQTIKGVVEKHGNSSEKIKNILAKK
jgi:HEPN domain-containing protein